MKELLNNEEDKAWEKAKPGELITMQLQTQLNCKSGMRWFFLRN